MPANSGHKMERRKERHFSLQKRNEAAGTDTSIVTKERGKKTRSSKMRNGQFDSLCLMDGKY